MINSIQPQPFIYNGIPLNLKNENFVDLTPSNAVKINVYNYPNDTFIKNSQNEKPETN
ncbi:MAG: hypothetical protein IJ003_02210 [Candidatus Gastranaerophilales bacterium]|nr:hypothetical protein [Candidatus Gastranaerophilales bacterium]